MKYMSLFLALIFLSSSVSLKILENSPVYESPVIVKSDQLTGSRHTAFAMDRNKKVNYN